MREMKDSGITSIGMIPKNWGLERARFSFGFRKGLSITKADLTEEGEAVVSYGQIHSKMNTGVHISNALIRKIPTSFIESDKYALCNNRDIIFADTSEDYEGIGNCVYNDRKGVVFAGYHTVVARVKNNSLCPKYCAYLFSTDGWRSYLRSNAYGIKVFSITQKLLSNSIVLIPSLDEQQCIASYLDSKCSKIDAIIEKQQTVIEKLKECKLSLITEAVTKGLNPDVPMKDSGVEWIGDVPEHWSVLKFGKCAVVKSNLVNPIDYQEYFQIAPDSIEKNSARILIYRTVGDSGVTSWNHLFYKGQILYSKIRPTLNKVAIAPFDGLCSADMYPIETVNDTKFIVYTILSRSFEAQVSLITENRVKMPKINQSELSNIIISIPDITEQHQIADFLDHKCSAIDATISKKQALIEKLTAYKKSLIYEVVTGKKEV